VSEPHRLGICTSYTHTDETCAAIQLADYAQAQGIRVTLWAEHRPTVPRFPAWDHAAVTSRQLPFDVWCRKCTHVIWTSHISQQRLATCRHYGVRTLAVARWDHLASLSTATTHADCVISPYACVTRIIRRRSSVPVAELLWDAPCPLTRSTTRGDDTQILVPLFDEQLVRTPTAVFALLASVLRQTAAVSVTIARGGRWSRQAVRELRSLVSRYPDRCRVARCDQWTDRLALFAAHDLTLWLAEFEGLASIGLWSLCMGTPVVAWNVPPQNEYLQHNRNSLLVGCRCRTEQWGLVRAMSDYPRMRGTLQQLLLDRAQLRYLQANAHLGLAARRNTFKEGWSQLWAADAFG